jgi:hypothetical protein
MQQQGGEARMRRALREAPAGLHRVRAMVLRSYLPALLCVMVALGVGGALWVDVRAAHHARRAATTERIRKRLSDAHAAAVGLARRRERERAEVESRLRQEAEVLTGDVLRRIESAILEKEAALAAREESPGLRLDREWGWIGRLLPLGKAAPRKPPPPNWPEMLLLEAMQALSGTLPDGATVAVLAPNDHLLHEMAGRGAEPEGLTVVAERAMNIHAAGRRIAWRVRVRNVAPDAPLPLTSDSLAAHLARTVFPRGDDGVVRGMLTDGQGRAVAVFPAGGTEDLPRLGTSGAWIELGDRVHEARLESLPAGDHLEWGLAMVGTFRDPGLAVLMAERLMHDPAWGFALAAPALLGAFAFGHASRLRRRTAASPSGNAPRGETARGAVRLVRRDGAAPPDRRGLTLAEVEEGEGGPRVRVRDLPFRPSGNLFRLQAWHRGAGAPRGGSRILDHARSPVLRELARRVRPADTVPPGGSSGPGDSAESAGATAADRRKPSAPVSPERRSAGVRARAGADPQGAGRDSALLPGGGWADDADDASPPAEEEDALRMADAEAAAIGDGTARRRAEERLRAVLAGAHGPRDEPRPEGT